MHYNNDQLCMCLMIYIDPNKSHTQQYWHNYLYRNKSQKNIYNQQNSYIFQNRQPTQ
jgi:hypothetical protein